MIDVDEAIGTFRKVGDWLEMTAAPAIKTFLVSFNALFDMEAHQRQRRRAALRRARLSTQVRRHRRTVKV